MKPVHEGPGSTFGASFLSTTVIAVVLWGSPPAGIRGALVGYGPAQLSLFRFGVASALLTVHSIFAGLRLPEKTNLARWTSACEYGHVGFGVAPLMILVECFLRHGPG